MIETGHPFADELIGRSLWSLIIPCTLAYVTWYLCGLAFAYLMTLKVEGKGNEWVLILNNGQLKRYGIGLTTFRGPYD